MYIAQSKVSRWKNPSKCRNFFISFAQEKQFDPFDWQKWQTINLDELYDKEVC